MLNNDQLFILIGTFIVAHGGAIGIAVWSGIKYMVRNLITVIEWRVNLERDVQALKDKAIELEKDIDAAHVKLRQKTD